MQGVFDVMAILERYPITKEHLEVRADYIPSSSSYNIYNAPVTN